MVTNPTHEKLAAALIDVRRAYRLLWAFQTRMLDYKRVVWERLDFVDWSPFSLLGPPGRTGNTVWAQLPMADMEFRAIRRHKDEEYAGGKNWVDFPKALDAVLYMRVRADTGMPKMARNDPSPLRFDPAEHCQTKLYLFIVLSRIDRDQPSNLWSVTEVCPEILADLGKLTEHPTVRGFSIFGQDVDFAALPDEETLDGWIDQFKDAAETALGVKFSDLPKA